MTNKYLTKVCALLQPPKKKAEATKKPALAVKVKITAVGKLNGRGKRSAKIKKHNGDTIYRQHKVHS